MKPIARVEGYPQLRDRYLQLKVPLFVLVLVSLLASFTIVDASVTILARHMESSSDLFASYADVLPGQSRDAIVRRGFTCPMSSFGTYRGSNEYCLFMPESGAVSQIGVTVSGESISQTVFILRNDTLKVGTLLAWWGIPTIMRQYAADNCSWRRNVTSISTTCYSGRFFDFYVRRVYFSSALKRD